MTSHATVSSNALWPCSVARPRHLGDHPAVGLTAHPRCVGLQPHLHGPEVETAPAPPAFPLVLAWGRPPADPAAALLGPLRSDVRDHRLGLLVDLHRFQHGAVAHGPSSIRHILSKAVRFYEWTHRPKRRRERPFKLQACHSTPGNSRRARFLCWVVSVSLATLMQAARQRPWLAVAAHGAGGAATRKTRQGRPSHTGGRARTDPTLLA